LDEREHSVEQVRSRLQADLALAQRERTQWESQTTALSTRADHLGAQLRAATVEGLRDLDRLRAIARDLESMMKDYSAVLETMDARLRPAAGRAPLRTSRPGGS
jgi:chromosome segregation ATPase